MAGKQIPVYLFLLAIISVSFSAPLQYQTLHLTPLPKTLKTQTLSWPTQFPGSESENTLSLSLHHIDKFSDHTLDSTPESLFKTRLRRDALRVEKLCAVSAGGSSSVISGLSQGSGEFFTRIGVGTPPKYLYMVLDTGSDVVWLQCSPCRNCYTQTDPIFNPNNSTSFKSVPCGSPLCRQLDVSSCNGTKCLYQVLYGDRSFTTGEFSTETLTFRKTKVPNIALGCGLDNEGLFAGAAGLLGLGRGPLGFPVQSRQRFGEKFSYCLVDRFDDSNKSSSILFGDSAVSKKTVFMRLVKNPNPRMGSFYYVGLKGFSVGGKIVGGIKVSIFKIDPTSGDGGVIVDSGTAVTRLTKSAYVALRKAFLARATNLKRAPNFSLFDACFDLSGETSVSVPTVVFHFDGADVSLPASNYLIPVDSKGTFCFAFAGTTGGLSIIGNIQQQSFRVVYDLAGQKLGFAPKSC
ncbi:Aspartyl protease protein 2 [Castilleja foliolosa]|uniref:Aspartyl protease protein 2 n=1 Tax=Castilleja foliolosa TaxID=1961234 RepID=A0ABD3C6W7_9LAMI